MTMNIKELVERSQVNFLRFADAIDLLSENDLYQQVSGKWSPAQHLQHLVVATKISTAAFALPSFIVRFIGGSTSKTSRTYDQLVSDYREKLKAGAGASGRYIPRAIDKTVKKEKLLQKWDAAYTVYLKALSKQKQPQLLEKITVKHPILGKISLLELAYFTIYHTEHHLKLIS